jgi:hypothetical protein
MLDFLSALPGTSTSAAIMNIYTYLTVAVLANLGLKSNAAPVYFDNRENFMAFTGGDLQLGDFETPVDLSGSHINWPNEFTV